MDLSNTHPTKKYNFTLQEKARNRAFFKVHHTVFGSEGEIRRLRFIFGAFDNGYDRFACNDHRRNVFLFDFEKCQYWILGEGVEGKVVGFTMYEDISCLIIARESDNKVLFINIENASILLDLSGHKNEVKHYSHTSNGLYFITCSVSEAIVWEKQGYTRYFKFVTSPDILIRQASFVPVSDNIVVLFQNDFFQIWNNRTLKQLKIVKFKELINIVLFIFTKNGRALAIGSQSLIAIVDTESFMIMKCVHLDKFNICGIKDIKFLPQPYDGGANKILAVLSKKTTLSFIDFEQSSLLKSTAEQDSHVYKIIVSSSGKYLALIYTLGEIQIYDLSSFLKTRGLLPQLKFNQKSSKPAMASANQKSLNFSKYTYPTVEERINKVFDRTRLQTILKQYGEYPEKYRCVIWRVLLEIPRNTEAYNCLVNRLNGSCFENKWKYAIRSSSVYSKHLKRTLLCLVTWCPLFKQVLFLPDLVFPFVKILHSDPTVCFEVIVTVLLNYCQLWFEFVSFPPVNILAMIENVLAEADGILLDHFCKIGVTSHTYAWIMLKSIFSEVLTTHEWLALWDHILSSEPSFVIMAIVSYNIQHRNVLRNFNSLEQFEWFYSKQNPINLKEFINNSHILLNKTSAEVHPQQYLKKVSCIQKGSCYPPYNDFPFIEIDIGSSCSLKECQK